MYNGLHIGLQQGELLTHNHGSNHGSFNGMIGDNDSRFNYSKESIAIFSSMNERPNSLRKKIIDETIRLLKQNNIWDSIDWMLVLASHESKSSLLNWKNPSLYIPLLVGSPSYTIDAGYTFSTNNYIDTRFNLALNSIKYSLNNGCIGVYSRTNAQSTGYAIGANDGTGYTRLRPRGNTDLFQAAINNNSSLRQCSNSDSRGLFTSERSSGVFAEYKNGVSQSVSGGTILTQPPNANLYIGCENNNGSNGVASAYNVSLVFSSEALGATRQLALYNIINYYMTQLGTNV